MTKYVKKKNKDSIQNSRNNNYLQLAKIVIPETGLLFDIYDDDDDDKTKNCVLK